MINHLTLVRGLRNGVSVTWELAKAIVPVYLIVTFLKYTPVLPWIARAFTPLMRLAGLPGEASLALVLGFVVNIYAAVGAIVSLSLTPKQITVIATIILLAHSLPVETAVSKKSGIEVLPILAIRLGLGFTCGVILNLLL
ncbi:MAG: nucleoside recognition domain-containing protein [Bacillota bacterium]